MNLRALLTCSAVAAIAIAFVAGPNARAETSAASEAKAAIRGFPQHAKEFGQGMGHAAKDTGRAIGHTARDGYYDVRDGFRRDVIKGGAVRSARQGGHHRGPMHADP